MSQQRQSPAKVIRSAVGDGLEAVSLGNRVEAETAVQTIIDAARSLHDDSPDAPTKEAASQILRHAEQAHADIRRGDIKDSPAHLREISQLNPGEET